MLRRYLSTAFDRHTATKSVNTTGLFHYPSLTSPSALLHISTQTLLRATTLVDHICSATTPLQISHTIKRLDLLSDLLCSVSDSAELIRCVHPDEDYVDAASEVSSVLNTYLSQLNTHQGLYSVRSRFNDRHCRRLLS